MKNNLYKHLVMAVACAATASSAAANALYTQLESVPTLNELGLVGLIAGIGVVAGIAIRRGGKK